MATTYTLAAYGEMLRDRVRVEAHIAALKELVRPDSVVLEIGTGPGFLACFAAKLGASRVYAMEPSPHIEIARGAARRNELSNKIIFYKQVSTKLELPERVDIIVSDLRGILPISEDNLPSIQDAVTRFLKPGGHVIPLRDTILSALAYSPETYRTYSEPWNQEFFGIDLSSALQCSTNFWGPVGDRKLKLLSREASLGTIVYDSIQGANFSGTARLSAHQSGLCHGVLVWFLSDLTETVSFASGPMSKDRANVYGQAFFPLSQPIALKKGTELEFLLEARYTGRNYIWRWKTSSAGRPRFDQTTAFAEPLAFETPIPAAGKVGLTHNGKIAHIILHAASQGKTIEEIASLLVHSEDIDISSFPEAHQWVGRHLEYIRTVDGAK